VSPNAGSAPTDGRYVSANGIDIHCVEAGKGEPLVLLHGGSVSTNPVWAGHPGAYVSHMETFARHFRVIAPDLRGYGRTVNPGGAISYRQLADDIEALIDALDLGQPLVVGNSDGGHIAATIGIRNPGRLRAIVNHAGFSLFDPRNQAFPMMREVLGGSPDATEADPDAVAAFFAGSEDMQATFELFKNDNDGAREPDYWQRQVAEMFGRLTQPAQYTVEDWSSIVAPTLVLTGDRDDFHSVEAGVAAYRQLPQGELSVLPNEGHGISDAAVQVSIDFLLRHTGH
jgi:pimeloyl-ACP methyl ester carboxylesterase